MGSTSRTLHEAAAGPRRVLPWTGAPDLDPERLRREFRVPRDAPVRNAIRKAARDLVRQRITAPPDDSAALHRIAVHLVDACDLSREFVGFAAVAVHNAVWEDEFAATPFVQRLLLLPACPRNSRVCTGHMEEGRFVCNGCGRCPLGPLLAEAGSLGYSTLVAEGTPPVFDMLQRRECDAILGVACIESLAESFRLVTAAGAAALAVPLLSSGCSDTVMDLEEIRRLLHLCRAAGPRRPRGAKELGIPRIALWRKAGELFRDPLWSRVLEAGGVSEGADERDPTETLALDWLRHGGKRLRPVMVLGAAGALNPDLIPGLSGKDPLARIAVAVEALHKASLIHDDIADDDLYRYGRFTLHRAHGIPAALNAGDHLIGIGYRLILSTWPELGSPTACRLADSLSRTHLRLCRGQGQELALNSAPGNPPDPLDVLTIYARKTGAAFDVSLEAGAAAAGRPMEWNDVFRRFARALGVAYQIRNDLEDWKQTAHNKLVSAQDALARRPTILRAFALQEMGIEAEREVLTGLDGDSDAASPEQVERVRRFYEQSGAFDKAIALYDRYRKKAKDVAAEVSHPGLRAFLVDLVSLLD